LAPPMPLESSTRTALIPERSSDMVPNTVLRLLSCALALGLVTAPVGIALSTTNRTLTGVLKFPVVVPSGKVVLSSPRASNV